MTYLNSESQHSFTDLPIGDYELNFDEEKALEGNYHINDDSKVKQIVTIVKDVETTVNLEAIKREMNQ
jgi:hypothetical protein